MMSDNPLVNLGDLSKPASDLIEKVSEAVGGIFRPHQIRRVAKAEADAAIINAQAEIEMTDLRRRAAQRWIEEEARRQKNMEDITVQAFPLLNENPNSENMDDDWIANLFDKCRAVSDHEMQSLWARVLATEANEPGTVSKRTVNLLSNFDKSDAEMFSNFCGFGWYINGIDDSIPFRRLIPIIFITYAFEDVYKSNEINLDVLNHLETIGLVRLLENNYFLSEVDIESVCYYDEKQLYLKPPEGTDIDLKIGCTLLTKVGEELAPICGSKPVEGFYEYVKREWEEYLPADEKD